VSQAVIEGIVVSFRTGPKTQRSKECIIKFPNITSSNEAGRLVGRKVMCAIGKGAVRGKVVALHGKNGLVRARFRKGLPGQIGTPVRIIG
jgi:large subunit ribosomal protein L35Ae